MSFLNRKYPFQKTGHWLRDCAVYCVIVFLILYLLQPFGFSMYQGNKFLTSLLFGAVTFACCYVLGVLAKPLQKRISPWRIWHEVLSVLAMVVFVGLCNSVLFSFVFHTPVTLGLCLLFLYWTLIIGAIISVFSVGISYHRHLRNQLETLLDKTTEAQSDIQVTIHDTNVRGNDLQLPINDLLYIEAQKNNVTVCYLKDAQPTSVELHTTLTAVIEELKEYENIFQCHRSFVVNVNNITSAKGNSNGYQLTLRTCSENVPVSRSYVPRLKAFIA